MTLSRTKILASNDGATGSSPGSLGSQSNEKALLEAITSLKKQLEIQARNNDTLHALLKKQSEEIDRLRAQQAEAATASPLPAPSTASAAKPPAAVREDDQGLHEPTEAAARQRLRRMCCPNKQGHVVALQHIVDEWKKCGEARDGLVRLFMEVGCCKDPPHEACNP